MSSPAEIEATKIWCSNVVVKKSSFSTPDTGDFDGAFAKVDFAEGELIEKGIMRRLPEGFDGNKCQECFTWSTERPNKTWAMGSGCSPYYNTHSTKNANTRMVRYFEEDRFEIFAKGDVKAGEELLHTYVSLQWRECFAPIKEIINKETEA